MTLVRNWRAVLARAWSMWAAYAGVVLIVAAEAVLQLDMPWQAHVLALVVVIVARVLNQSEPKQ